MKNGLKIVDKFLPAQCYTKENTTKKRICIHHTVGSPSSLSGVESTFASQKNISTQYFIAGNGIIYKFIPENYWAHHLGLKIANNTQMNKETIGIEIGAWGPLKLVNGVYMNAYNKPFDMKLPIEELDKPFRGYSFYQEYLQPQIDSLQVLLYMLSIEHDIPLEGLNRTLNFEYFSDFAKPGLYSHTNFRTDKSDVYPAKNLCSMLKMLKN
jgi:N-acetyl-anhydromuramyl-L-alanine amidase AmpD